MWNTVGRWIGSAVSVGVCFFKQKTAYEMRISDWSSDVCSSDLEHTDSTPLKRSHSRRPTADVKSIREAVKALEEATSPVLVIGAGANRTMTGRMLLQFIEKTGIPFLTTQDRKSTRLNSSQ